MAGSELSSEDFLNPLYSPFRCPSILRSLNAPFSIGKEFVWCD